MTRRAPGSRRMSSSLRTTSTRSRGSRRRRLPGCSRATPRAARPPDQPGAPARGARARARRGSLPRRAPSLVRRGLALPAPRALPGSGEGALSAARALPAARALQVEGAGGRVSAAEHAVLHLVVENVSVLAAKVVEDLRLGTFIGEERAPRGARRRELRRAARPLAGSRRPATAAWRAPLRAYLDLLPAWPRPCAPARRGPRAHPRRRTPPASTPRRRRCCAASSRRGRAPPWRSPPTPARSRHCSPRALPPPRRGGGARGGHAPRRAPRGPRAVTSAAPNTYRRASAGRWARRSSASTRRPRTAQLHIVLTQPVRLLRYDKDALERIALALAYDGSDPGAHAAGLIDGLRHATARARGDRQERLRGARPGRAAAPRARRDVDDLRADARLRRLRRSLRTRRGAGDAALTAAASASTRRPSSPISASSTPFRTR